jgi:hypothetical protein
MDPMTPLHARTIPRKAVEWLTPVEAVATLTHDDDRKLVTRVFDIEKKLT